MFAPWPRPRAQDLSYVWQKHCTNDQDGERDMGAFTVTQNHITVDNYMHDVMNVLASAGEA